MNNFFKTLKRAISKPEYFRLILFVFFLCVNCFIVFYPVLFIKGWPANHEYLSFFDRTLIYVQHFKAGDFIPLWSTQDGFGLGSPLPMLYHKLFYQISSVFYFITHHLKASVLITLMLLLIIGTIGLYRCLKIFNLGYYPSLFISLSMGLLNYTFTDWLVRGAMAEYAAMMILPWVIYWCLLLLNDRKFKWFIIPALVFTYLGHSIIGYYSGFIIILTLILFLAKHSDRTTIIYVLKRGIISLIVIFGILSLWLIPMMILKGDYDVSVILTPPYYPSYQFHKFYKYFYDAKYIWMSRWEGYSVELNLLVLLLIIILLVLLAWQFIRRKKTNHYYQFNSSNFSSLPFILISLFFYFFIQARCSLFFYKLVPGAAYVQFPWRLLTFIQLFLLLFIGWMIAGLKMPKLRIFLSVMLWVTLIIGYQGFRPVKYHIFEPQFIEGKKIEGVFGLGEYMPVLSNIPGHLVDKRKEYLHDISKQKAFVLNSSIHDTVYPDGAFAEEQLNRRYHVECSDTSVIVLPINYSKIVRCSIPEKSGNVIRTFRKPDDPRLRVLLTPGVHNLYVELPTLKNVCRYLVGRLE